MSQTAGIGTWTYPQFHEAVRLGKGRDGSGLCVFMVPVPEKDISETDMLALHAYLKSKPISDKGNRGDYCP